MNIVRNIANLQIRKFAILQNHKQNFNSLKINKLKHNYRAIPIFTFFPLIF